MLSQVWKASQVFTHLSEYLQERRLTFRNAENSQFPVEQKVRATDTQAAQETTENHVSA